jgi:hypothetical protein
MTTIPTQIRARLDAIAAERSRLDDEERRLKKALEALEDATPVEEPMVASGHNNMPWLPMWHSCRNVSSVLTAADFYPYDA